MTIAITNGRIVPIDGKPIANGVVLIQGEKILAVGTINEVAIPAGAKIIDAAGMWILPGFVEAHSHIGLLEEGEGWAGYDSNERTNPIGARMRALDGINPADTGFADALSGGVTTAVVKPGSINPIGGRTAALKCWGRTVDEMLIREPVSVKSSLGETPKRVYGEKKMLPSTRIGIAAIIRDALVKAQDYRTKRTTAINEQKPFDQDPTSEILTRVLDGELPWCQHAHRADDIATAIRLADEFGYHLIINHGTEAYRLADLVAERDIPVIVGPLLTSKPKSELRNKTLRNPGILDRAGVTIAITTDHPVIPIQFLALQATVAVKEGLDRETALRAITINPARIMGLDDRVGALKPGFDADIVLWSGDPLDVMSRALHVFINGKQVYKFDVTQGEGKVVNPFYQEYR